MNVTTQVGSIAASVEASRMAGIQQSGSAAAAASVQRDANKAASEADVRQTEAVQETGEKAGSTATGRRVNITV